jgi:anti-anti-sigma regulatory factor/HAMP domain-containing protein
VNIRSKLIVGIAGAALCGASVVGVVGYRLAREAFMARARDRMTAAREMKAVQVEDYFRQILDQSVSLAEDRMTVDAVRELSSAFRALEPEPRRLAELDTKLRLYYQSEFLPRLGESRGTPPGFGEYWPSGSHARMLQGLYLAESPFPTGSKHLLDEAPGAPAYGAAHRRYHPIFRNFLERFGFYDIFLIEPEEAVVVYSVFKEVDFATSLKAGPYRESNLAEAVRAALEDDASGFTRLEDFRAYPPSYDAQASFVATPIRDGDELVGVLALQMPVGRLNDLMTSGQRWREVGLGRSGEIYLVADDGTIRNQPRFLIEDREAYLQQVDRTGVARQTVEQIRRTGSAIGLQPVSTPAATAVLEGLAGAQVVEDYRGVPVLSAYRPLEIPDVTWGILAEIDLAEALADARSLRTAAVTWAIFLLPLCLAGALVLARRLTGKLETLRDHATRLAAGDLESPVEVDGDDEIAELADSFEAMRQSIQGLVAHQRRAIEALSTPLIPLTDEVVVMPLVGELDPERVARVRSGLAEGLYGTAAQVVILDVTSVPEIDAAVAQELARAAHAARLLGARTLVTGMQPSVAGALANQELHLEGILTERSLKDGIERALELVAERGGRRRSRTHGGVRDPEEGAGR